MFYYLLAFALIITSTSNCVADVKPKQHSSIDDSILMNAHLADTMAKVIKKFPAVYNCEIALKVSDDSIIENVIADVSFDQESLEETCLKQQQEVVALLKKKKGISKATLQKYLESKERSKKLFLDTFCKNTQSLLAKAFRIQPDKVTINISHISPT